MGNLKQIYKEKGIEGMTWLERMSFFIKYRFKKRYQKGIKYILEKEKEARYMEMIYERFEMDQAEYLRAVKKEIKEKAELDNAKLIGRREGYAKGEKKGFENGEKKGLYKAIKELKKKLNISLLSAMEILSVPENEYDIYIEMDKDGIKE